MGSFHCLQGIIMPGIPVRLKCLFYWQAECAMFSRMKDDTALTAPVSLHLAVAVARSVPTGYQIATVDLTCFLSIL
jgi:hypothetical protein